MYTYEQIKKEFYDACRKGGMDRDIPVIMNGRLTTTLGRVTLEANNGDYYMPTKVEFSKQFIATASDFDIKEVILHEAAHAIVTFKTGEDHGHDYYFKRMCKFLGTSRDGAAGKVNRIVAHSAKYEVICPTCNEVIGEYSKMCKTLRRLSECKCKACGQGNLVYRQNW